MEYDVLKSIVDKSNNIVFFGGAGVSTESGIPDFRSADTGIYNEKNNYAYPPEVILSHSFFMEHTEEFFKFYKSKMIYKDAKPNNAHKALAKLEEEGKIKAVITQNVDGLHQMAGSKNVVELHGTIHENFCMDCNESFDLDYVLNSPEAVPRCNKCNGIVKPKVVLYEEPLDSDSIEQAVKYIRNAEVLIIGGTSLAVYPAAGLIQYYGKDKLVLINKSSTPYDRKANLVINDSLGKVLGSLIE
ncbi:MAG TPA: NAD-dependent protein deacylase [Acetivibrio sp.]|jgi:NAD-dependent deacetylase|nr:NAD-dependent protein deacylase [Clostridium sp.]HOQ38600.1 NAD-dependent protein deacylase [Acetivibrio sp.]HPT92108.1 NAD-dependent protein deacylase [Acetivibrio sp.]HQA56866.1 NAD-dependent protein deacylase [Acetivibrio sp.]